MAMNRPSGVWVRAAVAAVALGLVVVVIGVSAWLTSPTPSGLADRVAARLEGTGGRQVDLNAISPLLREAVVATEDERFYRHHGIDLIGVMRALPFDISHLSLAQGASTITEQVAKVLYLDGNDHNPWRKLQDAAVAWKLENRETKQRILAAYLNSAYFGDGAYGVWAAAERYFGARPRDLNLSQASLIAGLIQAPSLYDPYLNPQDARARQVEVLRSMVRSHAIDIAEATVALARPLRLRTGTSLPPVRGVDLAPGAAFVWWQLSLGATLVLVAGVGVAIRFSGFAPEVLDSVTVRIALLVVVVAGAAVIVRSFRSV
jgi:membrane peptidoglycan carboxypeptidase